MNNPASTCLLELKGLGPKSFAQLQTIGIFNRADLECIGAVPAYLKLKQQYKNVSLNLLYALAGAIENRHWREVAQTQREALLLQLEGFAALKSLATEQPVGPTKNKIHET